MNTEVENNKKRVWALYRVSTTGQVNSDDDIPMQKSACRRKVAETGGWELTNELFERGVSGWSKSANDRDELNKIREAATKGEFDVLLVFMYDRIGRKEDESPLVVDFLHKHKIEVHSVKEGIMSSGDHMSKLMNYLTFWQSSGESLKTSMRVKEQMSQLNEQGYYMGGKPPFGYRIVETGEKHFKKKDKYLNRLEVIEEDSLSIKKIYELCVHYNYGRHKIASYLNKNGYLRSDGNKFSDGLVYRILTNPIYIGRKRYNAYKRDELSGSVKGCSKDEWKLQPYREELRIVEDELFEKAQKILEGRRQERDSKHDKLRDTKPNSSKVLLSGLIKCGYCGKPMKTDYSYKSYKRKSDGETTKMITYRYRCVGGKNHTVPHEKSQVGAKSIDEEVERIVIDMISNMDIDKFKKQADSFKNEKVTEKEKEVEQIKKSLEKIYKQLNTLNDEVPKALMGESSFSPEILSKSISSKEKEINEANKKIEELEKELKVNNYEAKDLDGLANEFNGWREKFENANLDSKKMMLFNVLNSVVWKKDELVINVSLSLKQAMNQEIYLCPDDSVPNGTGAHRHREKDKTLLFGNLFNYNREEKRLELELKQII